MEKPMIAGKNWKITQLPYKGPDGEEMWELIPNNQVWTAMFHLLPDSGKMYVTLSQSKRKRKGGASKVDQSVIVDAVRQFSQKIYDERNILCIVGIPATKKCTSMFKTYRNAGFQENGDVMKFHGRPDIVIFEYIPRNDD